MFDSVTLWKYGIILGSLLASGLGFPIPEELPVAGAGALVGHDAQDLADYHRADDAADDFEERANGYGAVVGGAAEYARPARPDRPGHLTRWWIMLPILVVGVVFGDCFLYSIGRFGGRRLLKVRWVRHRVLPPEKQHKIEHNFAKNGILILLGARFTPGIRTPVFVMAGVLKMPFSRFILADFLYAIPGVNLLFWLAYLFTDQFMAALNAAEKHKPIAAVVVLALVGAVVLYKLLGRRKLSLSTGDVEDIPAMVKPVGMATHAVEQAIEKAAGKTVQVSAKVGAAVVDKAMHPLGHHAKATITGGGLPVPEVVPEPAEAANGTAAEPAPQPAPGEPSSSLPP